MAETWHHQHWRLHRPQPRRADPPCAFVRSHGARLRGTIAPAAANAIADAIEQQEGYYPGSVAWRNNNPGNLVYAGQPGATRGAGGFAVFNSYADGRAAEINQITLDASRGTDVNGNPTTTIGELVASWAPAAAGNDPASYAANVAAATGFDPNAPLSSLGSFSDVLNAGITDTSGYASSSILAGVPGYVVIGGSIAAVLLIVSLVKR